MGEGLGRDFNINFKPNRLQNGFITSQAEADLFSSRRGEGKSTGLAWSIFYHTRHNPGANWAVVRDTFENLQKTTLKSFFEWFPPGIMGEYHITKKVFTWAEQVDPRRGTVTFVGMDDPTDTSKFLSWELGGIAMDEPAPGAGVGGINEEVFDLGMTSLRQPGMKWYPVKLAENNPDESHWTYRKFVDPGTPGFELWQPMQPENLRNLPADYYEKMRKNLGHRPDLVRRFVDGDFGFQKEGVPVTPQWNDRIHLANGLIAIPRRTLHLGWDFGLNPTCVISQITPLGHWNILYSFVGQEIGVEELIEEQVKPVLAAHFRGHPLEHTGDPAGDSREQSSAHRSAVKSIKHSLGGSWKSGPDKTWARVNPLQSVLARIIRGTGVVQVDKQNAREVWWALRGGWHHAKAKTGAVSGEPKKNEHSHPGDAMGYLAAKLFPASKLYPGQPVSGLANPQPASYWEPHSTSGFQVGPKGAILPSHGETFIKGNL